MPPCADGTVVGKTGGEGEGARTAMTHAPVGGVHGRTGRAGYKKTTALETAAGEAAHWPLPRPLSSRPQLHRSVGPTRLSPPHVPPLTLSTPSLARFPSPPPTPAHRHGARQAWRTAAGHTRLDHQRGGRRGACGCGTREAAATAGASGAPTGGGGAAAGAGCADHGGDGWEGRWRSHVGSGHPPLPFWTQPTTVAGRVGRRAGRVRPRRRPGGRGRRHPPRHPQTEEWLRGCLSIARIR